MNHFYQNIGEDWFTYPMLYSKMVNKFKDGSHFVEVGSWKGRSAVYMGVEIYNSKKNIKLDCVDYFNAYNGHYNEFLKNIKPLSHIIKGIKGSSIQISKKYKNNSLDFVFIDAGHTYDDVIDDLTNWLPKLKKTGLIAGHDYCELKDKQWEASVGVTAAVNDFFGKDNIKITDEACWIKELKRLI